MYFERDLLRMGPLNYIGGKFWLLEQILPYIPNDIEVFWDVFAGGWNVGINVDAETIVFNDINKQLIAMLDAFKCYSIHELLGEILQLIDEFGLKGAKSFPGERLNKTNEESYKALRKSYNTKGDALYHSPVALYVLVCFSFNRNIRFSKEDAFSQTVGDDSFNAAMRKKLIEFVELLHAKKDKILTSSIPFQDIDLDDPVMQSSFLYLDPPYLITEAGYNSYWSEQAELELLAFLDKAHSKGMRFALSNLLSRNILNKATGEIEEVVNEPLSAWLEKNGHRYTMLDLKYDYKNAAPGQRVVSNEREILVINYPVRDSFNQPKRPRKGVMYFDLPLVKPKSPPQDKLW